MDELIYKKDLTNEIQRIYDEHYADANSQTVHDIFHAVLKRIDKAKVVDAEPVVHGHRVIHNRPYAAQYIYVGDDGYGNLVKRTDYSGTKIEIAPAILSNPIEYCSECGKRMDGIWQNYCDNCGAKIDGGDEE